MKQSDKQPKQEIDDQLASTLMRLIHGQFCADMTAKQWAQHYHWMKKNVVLWPAYFICNKHKFTLPPKRYEQIMRSIFDGIKAKGNTAVVKFWPGYLMKCVQEHWTIHWPEYYEEAKAVRNLALHTIANLGKVKGEDRTVETMAAAQKMLVVNRKSGRKPVEKSPEDGQLKMF